MTTRSTSASAASTLRSGASPANRAAVALERTISEPTPDNDVAIASGRLKARKSVSGSGRSTRKGSTTRRVSACASAGVSSLVRAADAAQFLGHLVGRERPIGRPLGQRPADHAVDGRHGRTSRSAPAAVRAASRGGRRRPSGRQRRGGPPASRTGWRLPRTDRSAHRRGRRSPARAPCSAACRARRPSASIRMVGPSAVSNSGLTRPKSRSFTP